MEVGAVMVVIQPRSAAPSVSNDLRDVMTHGADMERFTRLLHLVAGGNVDVILLGETGVGKEVAAEVIHARSGRARHPLVRINCAALPDNLLETELFGHERGAFTGALKAKPGLLEAADGGSVFLDEICEMPLTTQAKLLRAVERREVMRLGSLSPKQIDVRFIAATNREIEAEVSDGRFRQDLYFRLNGITLTIPPLRTRLPELPGLARSFVAAACRAAGRPELPIADRTFGLLRSHPWPGNIRELRKMLERAVLLCGDAEIAPEHLFFDSVERPSSIARRSVPPPAVPHSVVQSELRSELDRLERQRVLEALQETEGNQRKAAELLGISRRTLLNKLDLFGLPRPRKDKR